MSLEDLTGTTKYISDLVNTNPVGASDPKSQGDDHIRGIKNVLLNTFPNITGIVTPTHTELNVLDGITGKSSTDDTLDNFPATTTKMTFYQAAAPTGWTQDTTNTDAALRVVSTAGGGTGGTHGVSSPPSINHVHGMNNHTHGVGTLAAASHGHQWLNVISNITDDQSFNNVGANVNLTNTSYKTSGFKYLKITTSGGGAGVDTYSGADLHTSHSAPAISGSVAAATGDTASAALTEFAPKYVDVIICSKN